MPRRNPALLSFGVFTSPASTRHLSKDDLQKAFFSTSSERAFYERKLTEEDVSENMLHVHNAGKTFGKYMPFKYNKAPLLDRESCHYTQQYVQRPMIGEQYRATCQVAASFAPERAKARKNVSIGDWTSKYKHDYPGQTRSELANAKPAMWVPEKGGSLEAVLGGKGKMMVTKSHLQTTHHGDFSGSYDAHGEAAKPPKGNIEPQGYHGGDFSRTSYQNEFNGRHRQRKQAVGSAFRSGQSDGIVKPRMQLLRSESSPS